MSTSQIGVPRISGQPNGRIDPINPMICPADSAADCGRRTPQRRSRSGSPGPPTHHPGLGDVGEHGVGRTFGLRAEAVIGAHGAGMNQAPMLARLVRETDMGVAMVAGRYTLLDQTAGEELLPLALERGVGVLHAGIFNSGLVPAPATACQRVAWARWPGRFTWVAGAGFEPAKEYSDGFTVRSHWPLGQPAWDVIGPGLAGRQRGETIPERHGRTAIRQRLPGR